MTVRKTSAADRARAAELGAAETAALEVFSVHQQSCYKCRPGRGFVTRACPVGYALFQEYWTTAAARRAWGQQPAGKTSPAQGTLW